MMTLKDAWCRLVAAVGLLAALAGLAACSDGGARPRHHLAQSRSFLARHLPVRLLSDRRSLF